MNCRNCDKVIIVGIENKGNVEMELESGIKRNYCMDCFHHFFMCMCEMIEKGIVKIKDINNDKNI